MENATKALLIAAGILLTILIISLGIIIFNQSSSTEEISSTLSSMQIAQINEKYERYEGIHTGSVVKKF